MLKERGKEKCLFTKLFGRKYYWYIKRITSLKIILKLKYFPSAVLTILMTVNCAIQYSLMPLQCCLDSRKLWLSLMREVDFFAGGNKSFRTICSPSFFPPHVHLKRGYINSSTNLTDQNDNS